MRTDYAVKVFAVAVLLVMLFMLASVLVTHAESVVWDKSTLSAVGACRPGGVLKVTITNGGQAMQGPVAYSFTVNGSVVASGAQDALGPGDTAILNSPPYPNTKIEFGIEQRPGHPGTGSVQVNMTCGPNAVSLLNFLAQSLLWWLR